MRLIIFSQPSVFIQGHLHAQLEHGWWHRAITIPPHKLRTFAQTPLGHGSIAHSLYRGVPCIRFYSSTHDAKKKRSTGRPGAAPVKPTTRRTGVGQDRGNESTACRAERVFRPPSDRLSQSDQKQNRRQAVQKLHEGRLRGEDAKLRGRRRSPISQNTSPDVSRTTSG